MAAQPEAHGGPARSTGPGATGPGRWAGAPWLFPAALALVAGWALWRRLPGLEAVGLSSDEAVYVGQGRALVGDPGWASVRAHPPLFGLLLDLVPGATTGELGPRLVSVALGVLAVVVAGLLGRELTGATAGVIAAGVLASMPYHADVTRLALVEVPMATTVSVALLLTVRAARTGRQRLLEGAGACLGVATLFKETALLAALAVALGVLSRDPSADRRAVLRAAGWYLAVVAAYPAFLLATGSAGIGSAYLAWQLERPAAAAPGVYLEQVLPRVGPVVLALAVAGAVVVLRSRRPGAAPLVLGALLPAVFYALWPVTGYPYLLAATAPIAVLAAAAATTVARAAMRLGRLLAAAVLAGALVAVGATTATARPPVVAGASGVPGVREAARWTAGRPALPVVVGAPWVANVVRYYRPGADVVSLTPGTADVSRLNPAYRGATTPDVPAGPAVVVWDVWSAANDRAGTARMLAQVRARGGRVAHVELGGPGTGPRVLVVCFVLES